MPGGTAYLKYHRIFLKQAISTCICNILPRESITNNISDAHTRAGKRKEKRLRPSRFRYSVTALQSTRFITHPRHASVHIINACAAEGFPCWRQGFAINIPSRSPRQLTFLFFSHRRQAPPRENIRDTYHSCHSLLGALNHKTTL